MPIRRRGLSVTFLAALLAWGPSELLSGARADDTSTPEETTMNQEGQVSDRIDYVEIVVADVEAAKRFYGDVFGWEFVDYGPDYASFSDGRLNGGFAKGESRGPGGVLVVFYAADLEAKEATVREAEGRIVREIFAFPGGRRFHFLDPDGNEFAVWSDVP